MRPSASSSRAIASTSTSRIAIPSPAKAQRGLRQQGIVGPAQRQLTGGRERGASRIRLPGAQQRIAASEQHTTGLILGARQVERLERAVEAVGCVLVGQSIERAMAGAYEHLGRP